MKWRAAPAWLRGIIDLALTIVFAIIALSGIALYLAPSGRIANTVGWTFLGLDKDTWTNIHTYLGFVMIGLVAVHLIIGFKSMITMLRMGFRKTKWKPVVGFLLVIGLIAGGFQVYSAYFVEEESDSSDTDYEYVYTPTNDTTTTYTYVEITGTMLKSYTLQQLADLYGVSADDLVKVLKEDYGIEAEPDELLEAIEIKNGLDREVFKEELAAAIEKLLDLNTQTEGNETVEGGGS
ncbi:DUF4405 domain-containing protein [Thermococcus sp. GR7]|uniref:DUF4405 domain-containing protein n=1 Tax=unclassified Thermococcus TaxID=2627626 RepID=UPI001431103C|nr:MULTISPECIES: DUF4405 domain-containing protein [unclassified Thermococcus]NJE47254.1 DUF4405 domain-containing protein [Thermococcus sp. GR7]NJE78619.1 DUF4405 domain-containing protein [Thermococcus sp. GR4]NJF23256.1 DUF4405 domain-containing protein [Thermococcus sp. GR5]